MNRIPWRWTLAYGLLLLLLFLLLSASLCSGSIAISPGGIWEILTAGGGEEMQRRVIWEIRLPRLLCAALLGAALSVSGYLLQLFFANPIAGPFVLGISSGAKLAVAITLILFLRAGRSLPSFVLVLAAFAGSLLSMVLILLLSRRVKRMSVLVVCGVMIGYLCSAVTEFLVTFADESNIVNLHNWSMGSFSGMSWGDVSVITALVLAGFFLAMLLSKPMQAYQLGEVYAQNAGVSVRVLRTELVLLSSLLSSCVTAFAGPISFVGVAVPHIVKHLMMQNPLRRFPPVFWQEPISACCATCWQETCSPPRS